MTSVKFYLSLILSLIIYKGVSQNLQDYKTISKSELLEKSWSSFSMEERKIIRHYLQTNYPDSAEGLFSEAYLANVDERKNDAILLYKKNLSKHPEHLYTMANLSRLLDYDDSKILIDKIIAKDSSFSNYFGLTQKFVILYDNKDKATVTTYLNDLSKKLPGHYITHYLWGRFNTLQGNFELAKANLEESVALNPTSFAAIREYINLGIRDLTNSKTPLEDRFSYFKPLNEFVSIPGISQIELAQAVILCADKLLELGIKQDAYDYYKAAFSLYPTAEAVEGAMSSDSNANQSDDLNTFLSEAKSKLPNNAIIEGLSAYWHITYDYDIKQSKQEYENSISYSRTTKDSLDNIIKMSLKYHHFADVDYTEAMQKIQRFKNSNSTLSKNDKYRLALNSHSIAFQNMDFQNALMYLEETASYGIIKNSYYEARRSEILNLIEKAKEKPETKPTIVATTALKTKNSLAISPDNKLAALGASPLQLWDLKRNRKLKDLGRGGLNSKFSPNGKYLATISNYKLSAQWNSSLILIYDVVTGEPLHIISGPSDIKNHQLDWNPNSSQLVYSTNSGQLYIYDLNLKKRIAIGRSGSLDIASLVLWHKSGKWIISGQAQGKHLTIHNATNLTKVKTLEDVDWPHALGQTHDGKYLLCSDNRGVLTTWDSRENWAFYDQKYIEQSGKNISAHPFKPIVAINSFSRGDFKSLITYNVEEKIKLKSTKYTMSRPKVVFSADGNSIFKASDNAIEILSSETLKPIDSVTGESGYAYSSKIDRVNDYYLTMDDEGVKVWNILNGRKVYTWLNTPDYFYKIHNDSGDQYIAAFADDKLRKTSVYLYNTSNLSKSPIIELDFKLDKIAETGNRIVFAGSHFKDTDNNVNFGEILITDKKDFSVTNKLTDIALVEDLLKYEGAEVPRAGFTSIDISNDDKELIYATYWQDGFGRPITYSKNCRVINISEKKAAQTTVIKTKYGIKNLSYNGANDALIKIDGSTEYRSYDRQKYSSVKYSSEALGLTTKALKNNDTLRYNDEYIIYKKNGQERKIHYPYLNLRDVEVFEEKNLLIGLTNLNEIEFYDLKEFSKKLTIISKKNGEYISYTPKGQYLASKNGSNRVIWSSNDRFLELNTLSNKNDELIKEQLAAIFSGKTFKLPEGVSNKNIPDDIVFSTKDKSILFENSDYAFKFQALKANQNFQDPEIELVLNGNRVEPNLITKQIIQDTIRYEAKVKFRKKENLLQVFQMFNGLKLLRLEKKLYSNISVKEVSELPKLWIYGIGVSKYKDASKNLNYPHKDVSDIVKVLSDQKDLVFSEVNVHSKIIDSSATHFNIEQKLDELGEIANADDIVLIYYSGHGEIIREELCIMPWEINFQKKTSRYRVSNLLNFAKTRRSEKAHTILMLDMCNSGAVKKELFKTPINFNESGRITVFASSIGNKSLEENGNGAFTAAMIAGIKGEADKLNVGNKNNEVDLHELHVYLVEKVKKLTNKVQVPDMTTTAHAKDFIISKIKN